MSVSEIDVAPEFKQVTGNARFYSITYRLFKLASLENRCEDYGQVAKYLGYVESGRSMM